MKIEKQIKHLERERQKLKKVLENLRKRGNKHYEAGNFDKANKFYKEADKKDNKLIMITKKMSRLIYKSQGER